MREPLRWFLWLLDEALDRVPTYDRMDGRWYRKGAWGCRLGLGRFWWPVDEPPPPVPCEWCGRAIWWSPDGAWLAVKGPERGYDPNACDASDDGTHHPSDPEQTRGATA